MKPYKPDQKKWNIFSKEMQLKNIAAELSRATSASLRGQEDWERGAYERAICLIISTLDDPKWNEKEFLYQLRDSIAALYSKKTDPAITNFIFSEVMKESEIIK